mmetsp:Transcript_28742/g.68650  ORF Transcript_28742/g.68650 Transcript_28742/m.68650 type:complete len:1574 (-) Transcript_28742:8-4729(-)
MDGNNGLLNEEFKTGKGIPFIALEGEGENEKFRLMDEAKAFLMQLKGPIAIAAIVGRYRTGKSLLVNRMLLDLAGNGFQVGSTVNSCTKGLWLWDKPLRCKNAEGQEVNLLIVDTEGIASLDADADHDAKIFALALLLSSFFIYNSVGSIDESALNNLSLVVELTKHIRTKAGNEGDETGAEFASFFPHFLWVVRDFTLQLVDENNVSFTPKQYLEKALTPMSGFSEGTEVKNRIRRMLLAFFPNRDCVTLKRPVEDEGKLQQLDTADWSEFRPEFVSQMKELRKKIYTGAPAKMLNGKMLDGFMLVHLAEAYSDSINTGSALNIGDAWGQVSLSRNKKAVEEGRHLYETKASALVKEMPFSKDELEAKHKELQAEALAEFKRCCIGTGADLDVFVHALMEELREELAKLQHKNAEVSRKKAEEEMEKVWAPLAAKVEAKAFGGYKEFETERLAVRKAFCDVTDGNPSQQEVLWAFMEKQIPPAAQAIDSHVALQTQTKLSEKEEEIKAAKNEGEQATIRAKAAEEELATRKSHAEEEKARFETQQKEMKDEVERARKELKERVEEEEKKRKEQVDALKKDLEEQVEKRDKQLKEEREKANSAQSELEKKVMLLEQKEKFTEEKVQSLAKDKESAQEQCRKLEGSVQDLNTKLLEAHKSAQEIGASAKEKVAEEEKKVEEEVDLGPTDPTKRAGKKTKAAAKKGKGNSWQILEASDVPRELVPKFVDPEFWLQYFPPIAKDDLNEMGVKVDWRRSFITTSVNPYYDSFIQWQFHKLRKLEKVSFGKRYSVYSPIDNQICADHDRASGEGVTPQEYVLIKMEVLELPPCLSQLQGKKVVLLAATLRPETMYGQTNCWVLPHEKDGGEVFYGCYETSTPNEVAIIGERAAQNMAFQGLSPAFGEVKELCKVNGRDLVGLPLKSPLTSLCPIYTLPMLTISMKKGTGVVTSVPSDAPDDWIALMDLKKKAPLREKYGVKDEWVLPFEVIPIIEIPYRKDNAPEGSEPEMTALAAQVACEEYKVASQNDREKLALAKAKTYKLGFYEGKMNLGEYKGLSVQDAKPKVKAAMIASGDAYAYAEPEKEVWSRSGNECVVALTDQWYLKYGEEEWRKQVENHLKTGVECYSADTRSKFENALSWLGEWGCSRSFGLGTLLPWDKQFVIESLSDSTIYMAYYTFCHILQQGPFDGSVPGSGNIAPKDLTEEVWDYVLLDGKLPADCKVPVEVLDKMKAEFNYWYPVDLRVSGKDLIQNHLTFFLYNHTAIFPEDKWPKSMRTNGHVLLNGEKMSKSTGNFKTLKQAIAEYSADGMRFALALSGDGNEDANFEHDVANAAILKLTNELQFVEKSLAGLDAMRGGGIDLFIDKIFDNEMKRYVRSTDECYAKMNYRDAMIEGWDKMQNARDKYRAMAGAAGMHKDLVQRFIEYQALLICPICPHFSEHVWAELGNKESVMDAKWPSVGEVDQLLLRMNTYFDKTLSDLRSKVEKANTKNKVTKATVYIAEGFLDWQQATLNLLKENAEAGKPFDAAFKKGLTASPALAPFKSAMKMLMPFAAFTIDDYAVRGIEVPSALFPSI